MRATKQVPGVRALRLHVGIVDSFPKLMSYDILRPVLEHQPPVRLTCHEGKLADLVSQLNTHRIDVVLSDEPASPGIVGRVFNHLLASSGITFCAMPDFAKMLKGRFPRNLDGAAALIAPLEVRVAELENRPNMNSSNSSKPPSSDGLKRKTQSMRRKNTGRKPGGQPGHTGQTLQQSPTPDITHPIPLDHCANEVRTCVTNPSPARKNARFSTFRPSPWK